MIQFAGVEIDPKKIICVEVAHEQEWVVKASDLVERFGNDREKAINRCNEIAELMQKEE